MRKISRDVPNYWLCDECVELGLVVKENFHNIPIEQISGSPSGAREMDSPSPGVATFSKAQPKNSSVKVKELSDIYSRSEKDCGPLFARDAIWKGRFTITTLAPSCEALEAHLAAKVHRTAYKLSHQMPPTLQFTLFPRSDLWSDLFPKGVPCWDDIALYFFPQDERSRCFYDSLLEFLKEHDFMMKSKMGSAELLLFSSELLRRDFPRIATEYFLWGVFYNDGADADVDVAAYAGATTVVSVADAIAANATANELDRVVDMEVDMIAGKNIGRVDIVVPKTLYNAADIEDIPPPPSFEDQYL